MAATTNSAETATDSINKKLDQLEEKLPLLPRRVLQLKRSIVGAGLSIAKSAFGAVERSSEKIQKSASTSVKTVTGQAKAQANMTADVAEQEAVSLLDRAKRSVDGDATDRLEDWTKAELYERAQALDIEGRSSMSKAQLITALRSN